MADHIGIVAVSAEGAALCYRTICVEGARRLGPHAHPEITLHTTPLADYMAPIRDGAWGEVGRLMLASAVKLAQAGADFLICPDNTVHQAFDADFLARSPRPWLHIAEVVAASAVERGFRRIGVLGTRYLMEGPVYPDKLRACGLEHEIPAAADRGTIDDVIMNELVYGRFEPPARRAFGEIIGRLAGRGCDAVVLGCTEIPLLIDDESSPLPTLDSTRLLARAALCRAVAAAG